MTEPTINIYVGNNPQAEYDHVVDNLQEALDLAHEFPSDEKIVIEVGNEDYSPWVAPIRFAAEIPIRVEDLKEARKLIEKRIVYERKYAKALKDKTVKMLISSIPK